MQVTITNAIVTQTHIDDACAITVG
jgi:hypothetical protein